MKQAKKDELLAEAKAHLLKTRQRLAERIEYVDKDIDALSEKYRTIKGETAFEDKLAVNALGEMAVTTLEQLQRLQGSPYFSRLDLAFDDEAIKPYYISKFSLSEENIYSWVAPIATLRFEKPGEVSYAVPTRRSRTGELRRSDQMMIQDDRLLFLATEDQEDERTLIYQEHFTVPKREFALAEIVAQMERAQDQVIRADHAGPFVISGPAGSGKTTLALHRVAYLRQAPETAPLYPAERIIVFVQDPGTQDYFTKLLPDLGIHDVTITTFADWALEHLEIRNFSYRVRPGDNEDERDRYEYAKLEALHGAVLPGNMANINVGLRNFYWDYLNAAQRALLTAQLDEGELDRIDLTVLMLVHAADGGVMFDDEDYTFLPGGKVRTKVTRRRRSYALIVVDEFQNYLPEQLQLLRGCADPTQNAVLYVGDMAQQTQFGTIRDWQQIGEIISADRLVRLDKVYRNTRQILEFMRQHGFDTAIPDGAADGPTVSQRPLESIKAQAGYVRELAERDGGQVGVIMKDPSLLEVFRAELGDLETVHCLSLRQAQGVEFETVCLVGLEAGSFTPETDGSEAFLAERRHVTRDQLYVALTRARRELHLIGPAPEEAIKGSEI